MLIILLSVLAVGVFSYINSSRIVYQEVMNSNMLLLEQAKKGNDQYVHYINSIMNQLISNTDIMVGAYIDSNKDPSAILKFARINKRLAELTTTNQIIDEIAIYYRKSNTVVNNEGSFHCNYYFDKVRKYEEISKQDLKQVITEYQSFHSIGNYSIRAQNNTGRFVVFVKTLHISTSGTYGTIIITVKEELLKNLLAESSKNNQASLYILDPGGKMVISNNDAISRETIREIYQKAYHSKQTKDIFKRKVGNQVYGFGWTKSESIGWYYIAVIPEAKVLGKVYVIRNIAFSIILATLLVALIVAYFLSVRIYRPISTLLDYLKREEKIDMDKITQLNKDELGYITDLLGETFYRNKKLTGMINKNKPILQEKLLADLLDGQYSQETKEVMESVGFEMSNGVYQVIVFEIEDIYPYEYGNTVFERDRENLDIINEFEQLSQFLCMHKINVYYLTKKPNIVITLFNMHSIDANHDDINEFVRNVIDHFNDIYHLIITAGVGNAYRKMEKISESYIDALFALKYKVIKGGGAVIYADEVKGVPVNLFEYPMDMELKLMNFIKSGDEKSALHIIDRIIMTNMRKESVSPELIDNLFSALIGTFIRIIYSIQSTTEEIFGTAYNWYVELQQYRTVEEKKEFLKTILSAICNYINQNTRNKYVKTYQRILKYIQENYATDLSLDIIGEELNLSPSYISWVFKEESGENLNGYLNKIRINKAIELLKSEDVSVKDVGEAVGFNSTHTFIRVFKKYEGVTPGQFKELSTKEE